MAVLVPPQCLLMFVPKWRAFLPLVFFRLMLKFIQVRLAITGPIPRPGTLIVANHLSWFDIVVIGAVTPLSFIAKSEVKGWPVFGQLARLHNTVFIDRRRGRHAVAEKNRLSARLQNGDRMVLFAEGTSTDGLRVLAFKSMFFAAVENRDAVSVQGLSLVYRRVHDIAMGRRQRMAYGWIGEMTLLPHFFFMLAGPPLTVQLTFHHPVERPGQKTRKQLAHMLHRQVSQGVEDIVRDRPQALPAVPPESAPS